MNDVDNDSTAPLAGRLPPVAIPPSLDGRIRASLIEQGLIRESRSVRSTGAARLLRFGAIAASLLFAGIVLGRSSAQLELSESSGPRYMLLLYGGESPADETSPDRRNEYGKWLQQVSAGDNSFTGEELGAEVAQVGPRDETGGRAALAGFFIITAASDAHAAEIARTSPHVRHGGSVVVQKIVQ